MCNSTVNNHLKDLKKKNKWVPSLAESRECHKDAGSRKLNKMVNKLFKWPASQEAIQGRLVYVRDCAYLYVHDAP